MQALMLPPPSADQGSMTAYITISGLIGLLGYVVSVGALLAAEPLWCNMVGAAMVTGMGAFASHLIRLVADGRRRRRVQELRRRMMAVPFARIDR